MTTSPFRFEKDAIARSLDAAKPDGEGFHGPRINLAAPDMPAMLLSVERLSARTKTRRYRSTANSIFVVMQGSGESKIGGQRFPWRRGDTIAAPNWTTIEHDATEDAMLFSLSDEPLLRFTNYYRFDAT